MDANTDPGIYPKRLEILETQGFIRDSTEDCIPTAYNPSLESKSAHLDYFFAKAPADQTISIESSAFVK